jgi:hypothetical protein
MPALAPGPPDNPPFLSNPLQNENAAVLTEPINSRMAGSSEIMTASRLLNGVIKKLIALIQHCFSPEALM